MSYYIMNADDDSIVERLDGRPSEAQLQRLADDLECAVYVIEGHHAGMTAVPEPKKDKYKTYRVDGRGHLQDTTTLG